MAVLQKSTMVDDQSTFTPVRMMEIELEHPLPTLSAFDEKKGSYYQLVCCLVRLHSLPLGLVELKLDKDELSADEYTPQIWESLNMQINEHLQQDRLPSVTTLTPEGLPCSCTPPCIEAREQFLAHAPLVSIIVATHDRPDRLATCLKSLISLRYPRYEIVVVDNAPGNNVTADLVQELSKTTPFIRYVREDRPGLSWARNRGILAAEGEIVAFTDDDVIVDPYWLVGLARGFKVDKDVVCVTGLILPLELETAAQILFEEYGGFNKGFKRRIFKPDRKAYYPEMPLYPYVPGRFGTGASMAFTADFLYKLGGFDPALGSNGPSRNGQDIAMFLQVILKGHKLVYQPESLLYHLHRSDYEGLRKQIYYYGVAITAFLTKTVLENPLRLFDLIGKVPYGFFFVLNSRSPKNRKRSERYPKELIMLERKGMLFGPLAYVVSRSRLSRLHS